MDCPICGSDKKRLFFTVDDMPVHIGILWPDKESALNAPKGNIDLTVCQECGHVFNTAFDENKMSYDHPYDNSLFFSEVFQKYAFDQARKLISTYALNEKNIVEIGSGTGDFLKLMCEMGNNKGIGFDPSIEPDLSSPVNAKSMVFHQKYYDKKLIHQKIDFIFSRHTLEHIEDPQRLIQQLRKDFSKNSEIIFYFEVPNANYMLREARVWDLIYEHCQYFTHSSLQKLFEENGFQVLDLFETFNGQYLCIECRILIKKEEQKQETGFDENLFVHFSEKSKSTISHCTKKLDQIKASDPNCVIWGAGAKGVTFLNIIKNENKIPFAVDLNPRKENKYIPVTAQKIILPKELKNIDPRHIFVMNPIYLEEIKEIVSGLGLNESICTPI